MICPSCQTAHAEPAPRFCDGCGLALPRVRVAARPAADQAEPVRCPECGQPADSRRCRGCGARVRWPEDVLPPDEMENAPGKPAAPALDLGDDVVAVELEGGGPPEEH